jgi:hypothetical protein
MFSFCNVLGSKGIEKSAIEGLPTEIKKIQIAE